MVTLLDDVTVLHHQDHVGVADGRQAVGDHEGGAVGPQCRHGLLDQHLGAGVDRGGRLVQDQQGRVGEEGAGDGDQLPLPRRDVGPLLLDRGVVALGQGAHETVHESGLRRGDDLCVGGVQAPVADVVHDGAAEQHRILQHHPHLAAQRPAVQRADVEAVQADLAAVDLVEAHDQVHQCRLAGAGGADDRDRLPGPGRQRQVGDQRLVGAVGEGDVVELDASLGGAGQLGPPDSTRGDLSPLFRVTGGDLPVGLLLLGVEQLEDPLGGGDPGDQHVRHPGDLPQRGIELARVLDEGDHLAQGDVSGSHPQAADHGDADVAEVGHPLHDRHDHPGVELGLEGGLEQLLVARIEGLAHRLLPVEHGDQVVTGEGLLDMAVQPSGMAPLGGEQLLGLRADDAHHHRGQRQGGQGDQRQLPGQVEHHHGDADDGQHRVDQRGEGLLHGGLDVVDVVGGAGEQVAALAGVEVGQRQPVDLRLDLLAQPVDDAHHHVVQQPALQPVEQGRDHVHAHHDRQQPAQVDEVDAGAGHHPVEDDVDRVTQDHRRPHGQAGGDDPEGEHDRQTGLVVAEGAEQAAQAGPEGLGLAGGGFSPFAAHGVLHLEDLVLGELRGRGSPLFAHTGSSTVIWESTISR